eukprot:774894-Rhodomonas_salina.3
MSVPESARGKASELTCPCSSRSSLTALGAACAHAGVFIATCVGACSRGGSTGAARCIGGAAFAFTLCSGATASPLVASSSATASFPASESGAPGGGGSGAVAAVSCNCRPSITAVHVWMERVGLLLAGG